MIQQILDPPVNENVTVAAPAPAAARAGWLEAAALAHAFGVPFSAHCGPSIHAQLACAAPRISHIEYFHDHVRIEHLVFDGALDPVGGCLQPDPTRAGLGLELKRQDAARYTIGCD
jgi:L-alanine-DL-glutamate epimerase-like enolase superfamily enzyme